MGTQKIRVAVMDASGGGLTILTTGDDTGRLPPNLTANPPAWSPDGTRIVYKHASDLFWMFANGYGTTPVISSQDPIGISWSR